MWKIADFGFTSEGSSHNARNSKSGRGTEGYRAPELVNNHTYTNKTDIWALGCILYELGSGQMLFSSDFSVSDHFRSKTAFENLVDGNQLNVFDEPSKKLILCS